MFNDNTWKYGENETVKYMKKNGYKILYTNFSCVGVELDIVSILTVDAQKEKLKSELTEYINNNELDEQHKQVLKNAYENNVKNLEEILVITEVKSRINSNFGSGLDAITKKKIANIKRGANYLLKQKQFSNIQVRFDVSSVDFDSVTYIENAF